MAAAGEQPVNGPVYAVNCGKCQLTALRLSPGEGGKDATLGKMQSPVALELLELLPRVNIPQPNAVVVSKNSPTARSEHGAV